MIWLVLAGMTALAFVLATWSVWRRPGAADAERRVDVYRRQLQEIGSEEARGVLATSDAAAARLEVERRLLRAAEGESPEGSRKLSPLVLLTIVGLAFGASGAVYLKLGQPTLAGSAHRSPGEALASPEDKDGPSMNVLVDRLLAYLGENPEEMEGWTHLRRAAPALGREADWARGLRQAVDARPENADLKVLYAESLIALGGGQMTPAAALALAEAEALDPSHPALRYYQGLALLHDGKAAEAEAHWRALLADAPPEANWRGQIERRIAEAELRQGKTPELNETAAGALMAMAPEDQERAIRGMVDGLAARLEADPSDGDGWLRLARAYGVLGEGEKARVAYAQAAKIAEAEGDGALAEAIAAETAARLPYSGRN